MRRHCGHRAPGRGRGHRRCRWIEAKYSRCFGDSLTTRINRAAGGAAAPIDDETAALERYADRWHVMSDGKFGLTSGALRRVLAPIAMLLESQVDAILAAQDAAWLAIDAEGTIRRSPALAPGA